MLIEIITLIYVAIVLSAALYYLVKAIIPENKRR